jgi:ABC-type sugar transport system ATPase subunit
MNLFEAQFRQGQFELGSETIETGLGLSGPADAGIRPEAIRLGGRIPATVSWVENLGMNVLIGLRVGTVSLTALASERPPGESLSISVDSKDVHVFEKNSGSNLSNSHRRRTPGS